MDGRLRALLHRTTEYSQRHWRHFAGWLAPLALSTVVGKVLSVLLSIVTHAVTGSVVVPLWLLLSAALCLPLTLAWQWWEYRTYGAALRGGDHIFKLDKMLFVHLSTLALSTRPYADSRKLLRIILRDALAMLGPKVFLAAIWLPRDHTLCPWVQYERPRDEREEEMPRARGNAGGNARANQSTLRETVTAVYRAKRHQVVHVSVGANASLSASLAEPPAGGARRRINSGPSYDSYAVLPLIGPKGRCLGALCVESASATVFDSQNAMELLWALARWITTAIIVRDRLGAAHTRALSRADVAGALVSMTHNAADDDKQTDSQTGPETDTETDMETDDALHLHSRAGHLERRRPRTDAARSLRAISARGDR